MSDDELRVLDEAQKLGLSVYGYDHANREFVTHVGEAVLKLVSVSRPAAPLVSEPAVQPEQPQPQQPQSFHQTEPSGVRTVPAALPRGMHALADVVQCLRETAEYRDEEGEATNALEDLLAEHAGLREATRMTPDHLALAKFYGVTTYAGLAQAQAHHIEKLQAKLPRDNQPAFTRVREG